MSDPIRPPRPLRVALVITELNVGGAERCLTNLALGLDRERFEPVVISLASPPAGRQAELVEQLEAAGVAMSFLDLQSPREFLRGVKRLARIFQQIVPDVVQSFLVHANMLGAIAARRAAVRAVITGVRVADPRRRRLWLERLAASRADRVVCVSQATADVMIQRGKLAAEKVVIIPNGIDLGRFDKVSPVDPRELGVASGRRILAVVGRVEKQKGTDWLLSLAPQLLSQAPHHDLVFVGDGPKREQLSRQVTALGMNDRVHFAGWRTDVPAILAACDMLLLPSRWEGMPNVVLEAMASRRPVIATRCEGVCELLGAFSEPQTVTFGESEVLIKKAVAILGDSSLAFRLGAENRHKVEKEFSLRSMVEEYQSLFHQVAIGHSVK